MKNSRIDLEELARRCDAAFPALAPVERRIAIAIHRALAASGPVRADEVARAVGVDPTTVEGALEGWPGVYRDESGRIIGFWGLTVQPMDHALHLEGRTLYGWCAWDTLFLPEILGVAARVRSRCPATGHPISLRVARDGPVDVDPADAVVSLLDPVCADVAGDRVISSFCHHIHFFASPADWARWAAEREDDTFALTVEEAWELGRRTNRLRYGDELRSGVGASSTTVRCT